MFAKKCIVMKTTHLPPFCFFFENLREKTSRIGLPGKVVVKHGTGYDGMYILQSAREQCQAWIGRLRSLLDMSRVMYIPGTPNGHGRAPYGKRDPYYSQGGPMSLGVPENPSEYVDANPIRYTYT